MKYRRNQFIIFSGFTFICLIISIKLHDRFFYNFQVTLFLIDVYLVIHFHKQYLKSKQTAKDLINNFHNKQNIEDNDNK